MKKIMILVLSLAVLFGFAACDNSSSTPSGSEGLNDLVVSMTVKNADGFDGKYFSKEPLDFSNYVVTATTYGGEKVVLSADQVSFNKTEAPTARDNENVTADEIVEITYTGSTYLGMPVTASISGLVYSRTNVNVVVNNDVTYYVGDDIDDIKENITVTGYALKNDGTEVFSRVLKDAEYELSVAKSSNDKFNGTGVVEFTVSGTTGTDEYKNGGSVTVDADAVMSISVVAGGEGKKEAIKGDDVDVSNPANYVTITYTMNSGRTLNEYAGATIEWAKTDAKFGTDETSRQITVTVGSVTGSCDVPVIDNYIKSFKLNGEATVYVLPGTDITKETFTVKTVWADDNGTKSINDTDLAKSLAFAGTTTVPSDYTWGSEVPVTVTINQAVASNAKCETKIVVTDIATATIDNVTLADNEQFDATATTVSALTWTGVSVKPADETAAKASVAAQLTFIYSDTAYRYLATDTANAYLSNDASYPTSGDGVVTVAKASVSDITVGVLDDSTVTVGTVSWT